MPNWRHALTRPTNGSVQRTGIKQRHIAAEAEFTSHLAINAACAALADAGVDAESIDLIVLATSTPDNTFPATAVAVQHGLGIVHGAAFDLQAVCSGFVFALATADNFLRGGAAKRALVIGAETFSRILDWNDRGTCVLFGDGAGAVVLEAQQEPGQASNRGILTAHRRSGGRHKSKLYVDGSASSTRTTPTTPSATRSAPACCATRWRRSLFAAKTNGRRHCAARLPSSSAWTSRADDSPR
jgi:3-oxoacyl-[acyl-carrier-protein] synthase-3